MRCFQKSITLDGKRRGCHLITAEVTRGLPELREFRVGLLHLFLQHTSASLSINENASAAVRDDMEMAANHLVPEDLPYTHTDEGPDDMPAHVKSSIFGCQLSMPVTDGRLALGTWQGIYLNEHRNQGGKRTLVATIYGESLRNAVGDKAF